MGESQASALVDEEKDVRDGDTAPRTPLWRETYKRAPLPQVKAG
jgi:hypothetical protein